MIHYTHHCKKYGTHKKPNFRFCFISDAFFWKIASKVGLKVLRSNPNLIHSHGRNVSWNIYACTLFSVFFLLTNHNFQYAKYTFKNSWGCIVRYLFHCFSQNYILARPCRLVDAFSVTRKQLESKQKKYTRRSVVVNPDINNGFDSYDELVQLILKLN